jgi:glycosyltransferase involved in cell wall biosynthesis
MTKTILVDGHCIDEIAQGSVTYITELYRALDNPGLEILFCCTCQNEYEKYFGSHERVKHIPLSATNRFDRYRELNTLVSRYGADFLHFQYTAPFQKRCKWINTLHDILFMEMREYFPWRYILPRAALFWLAATRSEIIITGSDHSKSSIESYFRIDPLRVSALSYGAPDMSYVDEPVPLLFNKNYFIYVSRIEPRKNHVELMIAFEEYLADGNDAFLVLVGARSFLPDAFRHLSEKLGDRLICLDGISNGQLTWLYKNSIGHIYPSMGEGFGFPVLESLVLGVPTACPSNTSLSAFSSVVDFILDPLDVVAIKSGLKALAQAKIDRAKSAKVLELFNWEKHANQFASLVLEG